MLPFNQAFEDLKADKSLYIAREEFRYSADSSHTFHQHRLVHKEHGHDKTCDGWYFLTDGEERKYWVQWPDAMELEMLRMFMRENREVIKTPQATIPSQTIVVDKQGIWAKILKIFAKILSPMLRLFGVGK